LGDSNFVAHREHAALHLPLSRRHGQTVLHGKGRAGVILLLQRQVLLLDGQRRQLLQG
jgi:hypothetical protein